jgi:glutathione S-transferase
VSDLALFFFDGSNASRTATLMLEHKGLAYREVRLPPGAHVPALYARGFRGRTVPAMTIDGRRVQGTRSISRALDALQPDPPLFPAARRAEVEDAERWGEGFADAARRVFYCAARRDPGAFDKLIIDGQFEGVTGTVLRAVSRGLVRTASLVHGASDDVGRRALAEMPAQLDRIDGWLADGVLDASAPTAADFQIAPSARAMLLMDDLAPLVRDRPLAGWALQLVPDYHGHVRAVLPEAWLAPLQRGQTPNEHSDWV